MDSYICIDLGVVILALIIFMWILPYFWSLTIYKCKDYQNTEIFILSVTHGNIIY
ncbi:hypothetical protein [Candidatus Legionella polyplacis]|uniref:hypothetical protein n=1 Tax=Candidatus Legionella polyplacis TaxID=2005262 RepID=UPI001314817C|nr:hypothetical protein [Candidatus Legionella polyplacis]